MGSFGQGISGSGVPGPETIRETGTGNGHENGEGCQVTLPIVQPAGRAETRGRGERKGLRLTCLVILPLNPISPVVFFSPSFACFSLLLTILSMMVEVSL